jgi:hypothetical protein
VLFSFQQYTASNGSDVVGVAEDTAGKMDDVKQLTNLGAFDIKTLLDLFMSRASPQGHVTKEAFFDCFSLLVERNLEGGGVTITESLAERVDALFEFLFNVFDADGNGVIDMPELSAGLSVLSGGSRDAKVRTVQILM